MPDYPPNPADLDHVPIELVEVQELIAQDGKPLREKKRARQFLHRLVTTLELQQRTLQRMHADLGRIQREAAASGGVHGNADPRLAAKYMTPEDLYPAMDSYLRTQVDIINRLRDDAQDKIRFLQALMHQIDFVVGGLLESDLPDDIRARLSAARHELPTPDQIPQVNAEHVDPPDMTPPSQRPDPAGAQPAPPPGPSQHQEGGLEGMFR